MYLCINNIFRIKTTWWAGYRAIDTCFGRLNISIKFLWWRSKSWKKQDKQGNAVWKYWYKSPLFGYKKWEEGRIGVCIIYNDFMFNKIKKNSMSIYYSDLKLSGKIQ